MSRLLLAALLLAQASQAQFYDLATTEDGSVVYFTTRHRRAGTGEPFQGRVYAVDASGLRLVEERQKQIVDNSLPILSTPYDMIGVSASSDGAVVALVGRSDCSGSSASHCFRAGVVRTTVRYLETGLEVEVRGTAKLSANGRFAVVFRNALSSDFQGVLDLATGETFSLDRLDLIVSGSSLADDGTLVQPGAGIEAIKLDGSRRVYEIGQQSARATAIDAAAATVVFNSIPWDGTEPVRLRALDLADGSIRTLVEGRGAIEDPILTSDGARVLFRSSACLIDPCTPDLFQAYVIQTDGSGLMRLTSQDAGVQRATLSGDGNIAYLVTGRGALVRIEAETGESAHLIARTPTFLPQQYRQGRLAATRGALAYLRGAGLTDEARGAESLPLPFELGGFRMRIAGVDVPLFSVRPDLIAFQMPWEFWGSRADGLVLPVEIETSPSASPFEPEPLLAETLPANPAVLELPGDFPNALPGFPFSLVVKGDFSGLTTPESPAAPGDVVHAYVTGLGAVENEPATGRPAAVSEPLARLEDSLICTADTWDGSTAGVADIPLLYAGLAPGLVGVYQVTIQLPADLAPHVEQPGLTRVVCRRRSTLGSFAILLPVRF